MKKRITLVFALIVLTSLACGLLSPGASGDPTLPPPSQTDVAAIVQQTLQAGTLEAPTSTPAPATDVPARPSAQPASGGSLKVAYALAGDIYLWSPGGKPQPITTHGLARDLRLSPDGSLIAYQRAAGEQQLELWCIRTDGSDDHALVTAADLPATSPDTLLNPNQFEWIPASHTLLYNTIQVLSGLGAPVSNDLRQVEADSGEKKVLLQPGSGGGAFYLSPDKKKVLLVRGDMLLIAGIEGGSSQQLFTYPPVFTYSEWTYLPDPVWNRNSAAFRVIIPPQDPMTRPDDRTVVWEIPADGSPARQLSSFIASPAWHYRPLLSVDGQMVAFQVPKSSDGQVTELHMALADLTGNRKLVSGQIHFSSWAPDSKRYAILMEDRSGMQVGTVSGNLYSFPVGIKPYRLTWIDGNQFLVLSGSSESPELYMMDLAGRTSRITTARQDITYSFSK